MIKYDADKYHRRSIRLKGYDYAQAGTYFVTVCTQNRELSLEEAGMKSMIQRWWDALPQKFHGIRLDQLVIMPDHIHGIIFITDEPVGADQCVCPCDGRSGEHIGRGERVGSPLLLQDKPTLARIVQWFKTMTTNEYLRMAKQQDIPPLAGKLWQRNYYEHIIRNEAELNQIREYIQNNPTNLENDTDNRPVLQEVFSK